MNETPKHIKDKQYKDFFRSIGDVLACKFCRQSYKVFFDALNIDRYLQMPSCGLIKFYYDLRQLINGKLEKQERKALHDAFEQLKQEYPNQNEEFWEKFREKAQKICYTKPAPSFDSVVKELYSHRAGCSTHMKTCRKDAISFPAIPSGPIPDPNATGVLDRDTYSGGKQKRKSTRRKSSRKVSRKRSRKVSRRKR